MPVVLIASKGDQVADKVKIKWLLEDIWLYENGNAELQLECIISSEQQIDEVTILMSCGVDSIEDLSDLYRNASFQYGYPRCWPDIYSQFEIDATKSTITLNGITARVGDIKASLAYQAHDYTEIKVKFNSSAESNHIIFRLGMRCKNLVTRRKFSAKRTLKCYAYGMAPFSGQALDNLLRERRMEPSDWLSVDRHIIYVKWGQKSLILESCSFHPSREYPFEECENRHRYCPPLERIAKRTGKTAIELKRRKSFCMVWEFENVLPTRGQCIVVNYFNSAFEKWISQHWLGLTAFVLGAISLAFKVLELL